MEKSTYKFLEFNGQSIYFLAKENVYWIALKPICEAMGIDFDGQYQIMKTDGVLGPNLHSQPMHIGKEKLKNWMCLPEFFIYGWIFSVRSKSKDLHDYQWKCYELLYNHFHGEVGNRKDLLSEEARIQIEKDKLLNDLERNPEWIQMTELEARSKTIKAKLKALDKGVFQEQLTIFSSE